MSDKDASMVDNKKTEKKGKGLNLIPNEIIGYRIAPEPNNWTVVLVKKKSSGVEYKTPLTYHKNLGGAISWIYNTVSQEEGKYLQDESQKNAGIAANPEVLVNAFQKGLSEALKAVEDLEDRLVKAGLDRKNMSLQAFETITGTTFQAEKYEEE